MKSVFLDSNVIVYLVDRRDQEKATKARHLVKSLNQQISLSVQVLQETYWTGIGKLRLPPSEVREFVLGWSRRRVFQPGPEDVIRAIDTSERYGISFWDGMIIESAAVLGCDLLYTEDLNHGQVYRGVKVQNPFK